MTIAQRVAQVSANIQNATRADEFVACAKSLMAARGRAGDAAVFAERNKFSDRVGRFLKSGVAVGNTSGSGWAAELVQYQTVADAFLASLAPYSSFDKILNLNGFTRIPMQTRVVITSATATSSVVAEGSPKPVTQMEFDGFNFAEKKAVAFVVISDELAVSANASAFNLVGAELRKAVARATDSTFLSVVSEGTGVASSSSSGMSVDQFTADFNDALASIQIGATSRVFLIAPPSVVKIIATLRGTAGAAFPDMGINGGTIAGVAVLPSDSLSDSMILLDATGVAVDSATVVLDGSDQAAIQMADAVTDGSAELTSLWQNNLRAIRAERRFACQLLRSDAVAVISNVAVTA
jgi:HK97 family phage major capsid protein